MKYVVDCTMHSETDSWICLLSTWLKTFKVFRLVSDCKAEGKTAGRQKKTLTMVRVAGRAHYPYLIYHTDIPFDWRLLNLHTSMRQPVVLKLQRPRASRTTKFLV